MQDHAQFQLSGGSFTREQRILKTDEFSSVFRLRPVQRSAHFVLYARSNQFDQARLGVVAAKRFAPRAITRNMIKRITREVFRQLALSNVDCVVRLSKPVNSKQGPATTAALKRILRAEMLQLFQAQRHNLAKLAEAARASELAHEAAPSTLATTKTTEQGA